MHVTMILPRLKIAHFWSRTNRISRLIITYGQLNLRHSLLGIPVRLLVRKLVALVFAVLLPVVVVDIGPVEREESKFM